MNSKRFSSFKNRGSKNEKNIFDEIRRIKRADLLSKKSSRDIR